MDYISQSEPSGSSSGSSENNDSGNAVAANDGSLEQNIVQQAKALVGSTDFRTADVNYGSVACAKVVSIALNNAGAISEDEMSLDCYVLRDNLKAKGWAEVTPPPYQEGDVIFWSTYDWTGDGVIDRPDKVCLRDVAFGNMGELLFLEKRPDNKVVLSRWIFTAPEG